MNTAQQEHFDKYQALADKLGWDALRALVPFKIETIADRLDRGDQHLNSLALSRWDTAAFAIHGIPLSQRVCVLKHVARVAALALQGDR